MFLVSGIHNSISDHPGLNILSENKVNTYARLNPREFRELLLCIELNFVSLSGELYLIKIV